MNQKLLNELWEKAKPGEIELNVAKDEDEDLHIVQRDCQSDGVDCMTLQILIEGNPEWHYCRHTADGLWKSMSECDQCHTDKK